jgi:AcrR family transcriptional regulator
MDDVADAAQLNKATVYHYYEGKAQLLYELCLGALDDVLAQLDAAPKDVPPSVALKDYVHRVFGVIADAPTRGLVYFQESPFLTEWLSEGQVKVIRERERSFELHLRTIVEQGRADKTFRDVDARLAALALSGMTNWFCRWYHREGPLSADFIADQFTDLIFAGILASPAGRDRASANGERERRVRKARTKSPGATA